MHGTPQEHVWEEKGPLRGFPPQAPPLCPIGGKREGGAQGLLARKASGGDGEPSPETRPGQRKKERVGREATGARFHFLPHSNLKVTRFRPRKNNSHPFPVRLSKAGSVFFKRGRGRNGYKGFFVLRKGGALERLPEKEMVSKKARKNGFSGLSFSALVPREAKNAGSLASGAACQKGKPSPPS